MKLTVKDEQKIQLCIAGANSLQNALDLVYTNGHTYGLKANEVTLFRTVLCYFKNKPGCTVYETHQNYVKPVNSPNRCEISDLLLIAYSRRLNGAKINFLQAKLAPFTHADLGLVHANNTNYFKFHLDSTQYRLLKDRPLINPKNTGLSSTILTHACSESITSYGVFYKTNNSIDMAYEITSLLQPSDPSTVTVGGGNKLCYFNTTNTTHGLRRLNKYCCAPSYPYDLLSTLSANTFEKALLHFQIGSPVCSLMAFQISKMISRMLDPNTDQTPDFCDFVNSNGCTWGFQRDYETDPLRERYYEEQIRKEELRNIRSWDDFEFNSPQYIMLMNVDDYITPFIYERRDDIFDY